MMRDLLGRTVALVALMVLAPLLVVIALAVLTTSPGPIIFRQVRVGLDGRPFQILKFRTMVDGADRLAANISPEGDPRITALGRWLRAWYLDELPQLVKRAEGRHGPRRPSAGDARVRRPLHARRAAGAERPSRPGRPLHPRAHG